MSRPWPTAWAARGPRGRAATLPSGGSWRTSRPVPLRLAPWTAPPLLEFVHADQPPALRGIARNATERRARSPARSAAVALIRRHDVGRATCRRHRCLPAGAAVSCAASPRRTSLSGPELVARPHPRARPRCRTSHRMFFRGGSGRRRPRASLHRRCHPAVGCPRAARRRCSAPCQPTRLHHHPRD